MTDSIDIANALKSLNTEDPAAILSWALTATDGNIGLACSFSPEDIVIAWHLKQLTDAPEVFAIDTGRLHEETYECAEMMRQKMGLHIKWYAPKREAIEQLERSKGLYSFRESLDNRHECCGIRKVEPLKRALATTKGWITGQRQDQSVTRTDLGVLELDKGNGNILKVNPLATWSEEQAWALIREHALPYNRLHDKGFPSIGCSPCTRAVEPGEHPRAGRWWWENPEHKECGLHLAP